MAATVIENTGTEPFTLPSPLRGILAPRQVIHLNLTLAQVAIALGGTATYLPPQGAMVGIKISYNSAYSGAYDSYYEGASSGTDLAQVRAATTADITLSAAQTIDGVSVVAGNRVLVKNQSTASENGIYVAAAGAWARASDLPAGASAAGLLVIVQEGTVNADITFICTSNVGSDVVGTDNLVFASGAVVDSLLVHKAGPETITGPKTFTDATSPIVTATLGPSTTQQHTLPVIASDTVALLAAAQTLTNKALDTCTLASALVCGSADITGIGIAEAQVVRAAVDNITIRPHTGGGYVGIMLADGVTFAFQSNATGFAFHNRAPVAQSAAIIDAVAGGTIDAEARTAINALLAYLRLRGDIAV